MNRHRLSLCALALAVVAAPAWRTPVTYNFIVGGLHMRVLHMRRMFALWTRFLPIAALALTLGAVEAKADHVFTLSGVKFDDGTSATGLFTTNDALNSLVNFDITTTAGAI